MDSGLISRKRQVLSRVFIWSLAVILLTGPLKGQEPERDALYRAAERFMEQVFPGGIRPVVSATPWPGKDDPLAYVLQLSPGGWILMGNDLRVEPVIGFSFLGQSTLFHPDPGNPAGTWMDLVEQELDRATREPALPEHPHWQKLLSTQKSTQAAGLTVQPLIPVTWNQGSGWNRYCPEDPDGPGGHAWVGCVAVAMAQAMSAYQFPNSGEGSSTYLHKDYGSLFADYSRAVYKWDSMYLNASDPYNALILYHAAVSVEMDFGPDGSGAQTSTATAALRNYFMYSQDTRYNRRMNFPDSTWKAMLNRELEKGYPLIYSGDADDGNAGHAFNIDGVINGQFYHLNWGWGGKDNGYFLIDNFRPGSNDFTKNQAVITGIRPRYYPTDILLSGLVVELEQAPGTPVGILSVVDEATDNEYQIRLLCDSTLQGQFWIPDYYLDGDTLRTGRIFSPAEPDTDTILLSLTDRFGHELEKEIILGIGGPPSGTTGFRDEPAPAFSLYPNPASRILYISMDGYALTGLSVKIFDIRGSLVKNRTLSGPSLSVDISDLDNGLYILVIYRNGLPVNNSRFIKTR